MNSHATLARPYAQALFELASVERRVFWSRHLALLTEALGYEAVSEHLSDPSTSEQQRQRLLQQLCGSDDAELARLLQLLLEKKRTAMVPALLAAFTDLVAQADNLARANVTTAVVPEQAEKDRIAQALAQRLGRRPELTWQLDPSLVAGFVVQIGDWVLDASVKGKLEQLEAGLSH